MLEKNGIWSVFCGKTSTFLNCLLNGKIKPKRAFTLTEMLIALVVVAILAVLILPVVTTRAQNKSFALSYESQVKQMLNSLTGLHVMENKTDFRDTMMYVDHDTDDYSSSSGAYINKYMKVSKYCNNSPGDCFAQKYYEYKNNDREQFDSSVIKGACALLKNGASICLKPQIKTSTGGVSEISGWLDLNGPKGPNVYGRDLRTFRINLSDRIAYSEEDPMSVIMPEASNECIGSSCQNVPDACIDAPSSQECCLHKTIVAAGDPCCPWYTAEGSAYHDICWGPPEEPKDPECKDHAIENSNDSCCIQNGGSVQDPNCCPDTDTSDYCCATRNAGTKACCDKGIAAGTIVLNEKHACCKNPEIAAAHVQECVNPCELDEENNKDLKTAADPDAWRKGRSLSYSADGSYCCDYYSRRKEILKIGTKEGYGPEDGCCMFKNNYDDKTNPVSASHCCRLQKFPETNPAELDDLCCTWRFTKSDLDGVSWLKTHSYISYPNDSAANDTGTDYSKRKFDTCCSYALSKIAKMNSDGTWTTTSDSTVWSDANIQAKVWQNCCSVGSMLSSGNAGDENAVANKNWKYQSRDKGTVDLSAECCHFLVANGSEADGYGRPGLREINPKTGKYGLLRNACCGYDEFKDYPECCSAGIDGLNVFRSSNDQWREICCMPGAGIPNGTYTQDETTASGPSIKCCLDAGPKIVNENKNWFWSSTALFVQSNNNRLTGCCSQGLSNAEDGTPLRTHDKWLVNCCYSRYKSYKNSTPEASRIPAYASDADFVRGCCSDSEYPAKSEKSVSWATGDDSDHNEECCMAYGSSTDIDSHSRNDKWWWERCCQKEKTNSVTPHEFHFRDGGCCRNVNWVEDGSESCCQFGVDNKTGKGLRELNDRYWYSNCCNYDTQYKGASSEGKSGFGVYRRDCCYNDKSWDNDGLRLSEYGILATKSDPKQQTFNDENKFNKYCCDPDIAKSDEAEESDHSGAPSENCCRAFIRSDDAMVTDWDDKKLSEAYRGRCCRHYAGMRNEISNLTCTELWICQANGKNSTDPDNDPGYGLPTCCHDLKGNNKHDIWRGACCDFPEDYQSNADYRSVCCSESPTDDYHRVNRKSGSSVVKEGTEVYCCKPNIVADGGVPSTNCCRYFKDKKSNYARGNGPEAETLSDDYKIECCRQSTGAVDSTTDYCPDCRIRWLSGIKYSYTPDAYSDTAWQHYNFKGCCTNSDIYATYKDKDIWLDNCCNYVGSSIDSVNKWYGTHVMYRAHCCGTGEQCEGEECITPQGCGEPSADGATSTCCAEWATNDKLTAGSDATNKCCEDSTFKSNHTTLCGGGGGSETCTEKDWSLTGADYDGHSSVMLYLTGNVDASGTVEIACNMCKGTILSGENCGHFKNQTKSFGTWSGSVNGTRHQQFMGCDPDGEYTWNYAVNFVKFKSVTVTNHGNQIYTYSSDAKSFSGKYDDGGETCTKGNGNYEPTSEVTCPSTPSSGSASPKCCTQWGESAIASVASQEHTTATVKTVCCSAWGEDTNHKTFCCADNNFKAGHSTFCSACPATPDTNGTEACCTEWKNAGKLTGSEEKAATGRNYCCTRYDNFYKSNKDFCCAYDSDFDWELNVKMTSGNTVGVTLKKTKGTGGSNLKVKDVHVVALCQNTSGGGSFNKTGSGTSSISLGSDVSCYNPGIIYAELADGNTVIFKQQPSGSQHTITGNYKSGQLSKCNTDPGNDDPPEDDEPATPKTATCTATVSWDVTASLTTGNGNGNVFFRAEKVNVSNIYCSDGGSMTDEQIAQFMPVMESLTATYNYVTNFGAWTNTASVTVGSNEMYNNGIMSNKDSVHIFKEGIGFFTPMNPGDSWQLSNLYCQITVYGGGSYPVCSGTQTFAMTVTRGGSSSLMQRVIAAFRDFTRSIISKVNDVRISIKHKIDERNERIAREKFEKELAAKNKDVTGTSAMADNVITVDQDNKTGVTTPDWHCCVPEHEQPTKECCEAFKKHVVNGREFMDFEPTPNPLSHDYKLRCCDLYDVCPTVKDCVPGDEENNVALDNCRVREETNDPKKWAIPQCCACLNDRRVDDVDWKKTCCPYVKGSDSDSLDSIRANTLLKTALANDTAYRTKCCLAGESGSDGSIYSTKSGDQDERCCNYNSGSNSNAFCCAKKQKGKNSRGTVVVWEITKDGKEISDFRNKCCMNVGDQFCTCSGLYTKWTTASNLNSHMGTNKVVCCADLNSYGNKTGEMLWKQACCPVAKDNTSTIIGTDSQFRSLCCNSSKYSCIYQYSNTCSTDKDNKSLSDGKDWRCCTLPSGSMPSSASDRKGKDSWFCCESLPTVMTKNITHSDALRNASCCKSEGIRHGNIADPQCCTYNSSNSITDQCCAWRRDAVNAPSGWIPWDGTLASDSFRNSCCTTFKGSDTSKKYCTCEYNYSSNTSHLTGDCCSYLHTGYGSSTGRHGSEDNWRKNCCSKTVPGSSLLGKTQWQPDCCVSKVSGYYDNGSVGCCTWRRDNNKFDRGRNAFTDKSSQDGCCAWWNSNDQTTYRERCCHNNKTDESCCRYMHDQNNTAPFYEGSPCCTYYPNDDRCLDRCTHYRLGHSYYYNSSGMTSLTAQDKRDCCVKAFGNSAMYNQNSTFWHDSCCTMAAANGSDFAIGSYDSRCCSARTRGDAYGGKTIYYYTYSSWKNGCKWDSSDCSSYGYNSWSCSSAKCDYGNSNDYNDYCCNKQFTPAKLNNGSNNSAKSGCCALSSFYDKCFCDCGTSINPTTSNYYCCDCRWNSLTSGQKTTCCDLSSIREDYPGTCCGSSVSSSKANKECCSYWSVSKIEKDSSVLDSCCSYSSFRSRSNTARLDCDCGPSYANDRTGNNPSEECCDHWGKTDGVCEKYQCSKTYKWKIEYKNAVSGFSNTPEVKFRDNLETSGDCPAADSISFSYYGKVTYSAPSSGTNCSPSSCTLTPSKTSCTFSGTACNVSQSTSYSSSISDCTVTITVKKGSKTKTISGGCSGTRQITNSDIP